MVKCSPAQILQTTLPFNTSSPLHRSSSSRHSLPRKSGISSPHVVVASSTVPLSWPLSSPNLMNVACRVIRSAETLEVGTRNFVVVRILWVVSGEVWYVVIVLVFVRGSKWVSCVEERMMGSGRGEGEREESDSKSERSNQSLLKVRKRRWAKGTFEVWMSLWRRLVRRGAKWRRGNCAGGPEDGTRWNGETRCIG